MKLCILITFVTLLGLVSLTTARFVPFNVNAMPRSASLRYGSGAVPMSVFEGESSYGGVGENNFHHGLGGAVFNIPLRSLTRSFKPQYGTFTDGSDAEHQPDSDAVPWTTY